MSKLRILGHAFGADIAVFEPDDGMPSPPAKLPVVGDEIEVWVLGSSEVDDHWMKLTVYKIEDRDPHKIMHCGCSPAGIYWQVPMTGPAATWRWHRHTQN